jgi:AraC family transcriptional regulator
MFDVSEQTRPVRVLRPTPTEMPRPLLSSRSRGWNGIVVELMHFHRVDVIVEVRDHVIGIHLAGAVNLLQQRNGRSLIRLVRPGDVTITPAGEPKRFQHGGDNMVILLKLAPWFVQTVAGDERAIDPTRVELQENFCSPDPELVRLGKAMLCGLEPEGLAGRLYVDAVATRLALHLLKHYSTVTVQDERPVAKLSRHKLQRAIDYIDANLRSDLALRDIAQALAMSPGHFAHAFRQSTGLSPHRYVLARRVERAKALLCETDLSITEIADRIGCASHSHFSVMFHRMTGRTPRDYRRET